MYVSTIPYHFHVYVCILQCRVCTKCGSLISPVLLKTNITDSAILQERKEWSCKFCEEDANISVISVSYVFRYLVAELAAMNIKVHLEVK